MRARHVSGGWRAGATLLFVLVFLGLQSPERAAAHAFLEQSTPAANAVLPFPPPQLRLRFTEPLEPRFSRIELFNADGDKIEIGASQIGSDPFELVLPLTTQLARGTYTVQWRNLSTADGHPEVGFFPFTIGNQSDVVTPTPPLLPQPSAAAGTLGTVGRWLSLLGIAAAVGAVACWRWVVSYIVSRLRKTQKQPMVRRIWLLTLCGIATALLGSLVLLLAQASNAGGINPTTLWGVLSDTYFGRLLIVRVLTLLVFGVVVLNAATWAVAGRDMRFAWLAIGAAAASLVPFSLVSHAAAQPTGQLAAVAVDWLHLAAASVWIGGLLTLLVGLILMREVSSEQRRNLYAAVIPRFSSLAIASVIILTLTGIYSSWLQVGNLDALRNTSYGRTLAIKLALIVPLLALGAWNLLVTGRSTLQSVQERRRFARAVLGEVVFGGAVLLVVGVLISLPPARDALTAGTGHSVSTFNQGSIYAAFHVSPGVVGMNLYTADVTPVGEPLPDETQVLLRVARDDTIEGVREIALSRVPGSASRFEARGSELSVVGEWQAELIIRRPNTTDWRERTSLQITRTTSAARAPSDPPYFLGISAVVGVLAIGTAIVLVVVVVRRREAWSKRQFPVEVGGALAVIGLVLLLLSRGTGEPVAAEDNPVPKTVESVASGAEHYQHLCASCHGQEGRGDGPAAAGLIPPPADLHAAHLDDHSDRQFFLWVSEGINNSAMPGFKNELTEEQIWDLVNYVRSLRHPIETESLLSGTEVPE